MYLKENYSDSPSNEYSRHYSAESESEYQRRQNMNSNLGEEQKKKKKRRGHHVRRSPNFDSNPDIKQKKGQNNNGLILGRVSINTQTRPSPSNALLLSRVLGLDSAHPYFEEPKCSLSKFLFDFGAVIDCSFISNLITRGHSKLLNGSSSQTFKNTGHNHFF